MDCHKAAYVPVCIAGDETLAITAEPAFVIPTEFDDDDETVYDDSFGDLTESYPLVPSSFKSDRSFNGDKSTLNLDKVESRFNQQPGATTRRSVFLPLSLHEPESPQFVSRNIPGGGQQLGPMMRRHSALGSASARHMNSLSSLSTPNSLQRRYSLVRRSSLRGTNEPPVMTMPTLVNESPLVKKSPMRRMKARESMHKRSSRSVTQSDFPLTPML